MNGIEAIIGVIAFIGVVAAAVAARPRPERTMLLLPRRAATARPSPTRRILVGMVGVVLVGALMGPFAALAVVAVVAIRPQLSERQRSRRRAAAIACEFPDFVDLLVITIRSGCTPVQAFRSLRSASPEPVRKAVAAVVRRVDDGERFADAVGALPRVLGPTGQHLADALALADRHGTPLAPTLDRLADEARAQRRRNAELAARQLPIRLSFPLVGCTLPSFVLLTIVPLMAGTLSSLPGLRP